MAAKICKQWVDHETEHEVITLVDSFGRKFLLQISIHAEDRDEQLATEMAAMNEREARFEASLQKKGYDPKNFLKSAKDCGCSG